MRSHPLFYQIKVFIENRFPSSLSNSKPDSLEKKAIRLFSLSLSSFWQPLSHSSVAQISPGNVVGSLLVLNRSRSRNKNIFAFSPSPLPPPIGGFGGSCQKGPLPFIRTSSIHNLLTCATVRFKMLMRGQLALLSQTIERTICTAQKCQEQMEASSYDKAGRKRKRSGLCFPFDERKEYVKGKWLLPLSRA